MSEELDPVEAPPGAAPAASPLDPLSPRADSLSSARSSVSASSSPGEVASSLDRLSSRLREEFPSPVASDFGRPGPPAEESREFSTLAFNPKELPLSNPVVNLLYVNYVKRGDMLDQLLAQRRQEREQRAGLEARIARLESDARSFESARASLKREVLQSAQRAKEVELGLKGELRLRDQEQKRLSNEGRGLRSQYNRLRSEFDRVQTECARLTAERRERMALLPSSASAAASSAPRRRLSRSSMRSASAKAAAFVESGSSVPSPSPSPSSSSSAPRRVDTGTCTEGPAPLDGRLLEEYHALRAAHESLERSVRSKDAELSDLRLRLGVVSSSSSSSSSSSASFPAGSVASTVMEDLESLQRAYRSKLRRVVSSVAVAPASPSLDAAAAAAAPSSSSAESASSPSQPRSVSDELKSDLLRNVSVALGVSELSDVLPSLEKLSKIVRAVPRMESFISEVGAAVLGVENRVSGARGRREFTLPDVPSLVREWAARLEAAGPVYGVP